MTTKEKIIAIDLFCGGGGSSNGLANACKKMGRPVELLAINHWDTAIETHARNHPWAVHMKADLASVQPKAVVPGERANILVASPECTHHSNARGGRPMNDQSRSSAGLVIKWLAELYIENVLIENVAEFQDWAPLGSNGRPLKSRKGELFRWFIDGIKTCNYRVEWRELVCANYGDPTTRKRLFILAKKNHRKIFWPAQTHAPAHEIDQLRLDGANLKPWVPAREIIDWNIEGNSIFGRNKPLAMNTLQRIEAGMKKFNWPEPFLVILRQHMAAVSTDDTLPTITAGGTHIGLVEPVNMGTPFILQQQSGGVPRSVDEPVPTIATGGAQSMIEPFTVNLQRLGKRAEIDGVNEPMRTVTATSSDFAMVAPFSMTIDQGSTKQTARSVDDPVPTVTVKNRVGVVEPFVAELRKGKKANSTQDPLSTVTTMGAHHGVVEGKEFLVRFQGNRERDKNRSKSVDDPLGTQETSNRFGLAEARAFMIAAGGPTGKGRTPKDINDPMASVITENHEALIEPFMVPNFGERVGQQPRTHSIDQPLPAVTSHGAGGVIEPIMLNVNHGEGDIRIHRVEDPLPTISTKNGVGIATAEAVPFQADGMTATGEPFLVIYYSTNDATSINDPLDTVTTKPRFGVVWGNTLYDIRFRMLQPSELALAQGFPKNYIFLGSKAEQTKMIGNAVPGHTSEALCHALIDPSRLLEGVA